MRWCLVLVVILAVLVAALAKVASRERGAAARRPPIPGPPATAGEDGDDTREESAASPRPTLRRPPQPRLPTVEKTAASRPGIARLHGHVRWPARWSNRVPGKNGQVPGDAQEAIELEDVSVVATDGARTLAANPDHEGRFAFHLPPGVYTLSVSTGPWFATRADVLARGGVDREVDLELAMGATISGRLRRSTTDRPARVWARPAGAGPTVPPIAQVNIHDEAEFTVRGLVPGRRYDLTVAGDGIRTVRLPGVMAPAAGLDVNAEPRPILRGAIGVPPGERCPIEVVVLRAVRGDASTSGMREVSAFAGSDDGEGPDGACAFEVSVPDDVTSATIVATGSGWHLEEPVEIPASGDPPPVCLNPPCANPQDVAADVVVEFSEPGEFGGVVVCLTSTEPGLGESCGSTDTGRYVFKRRSIGSTLIVSTGGEPCVSDQRTITVQRGENRVGLACRRPTPGPDPDHGS